MLYVEGFNTWVLSEWDKAAHGEPEEDEGVVGEFITVDVDDEEPQSSSRTGCASVHGERC